MHEMSDLATEIRQIAEQGDFSGVCRLEFRGQVVDEFARGDANRAEAIMHQLDTRLAVASATKGLTALTAMSLVDAGLLSLDTTVAELAGDVLPLVDERATIAHVLRHTSGVGDYLDEETLGDSDEHVLDVSAHTLETPSDYLPLIARYPQVFPPGERFAYNNGAFVMLSFIIERITGSFHDAVAERVLQPAGMSGGGFFRSDALPANTALGYLENGRTNVFHLPVIGAGDGGIYMTLDDVSSLWDAFFAGLIVAPSTVELMTTPTQANDDGNGYGLGFLLHRDGDAVALEGADAGVSFRSLARRSTECRYVVISNTSTGAWPLARRLDAALRF